MRRNILCVINLHFKILRSLELKKLLANLAHGPITHKQNSMKKVTQNGNHVSIGTSTLR